MSFEPRKIEIAAWHVIEGLEAPLFMHDVPSRVLSIGLLLRDTYKTAPVSYEKASYEERGVDGNDLWSIDAWECDIFGVKKNNPIFTVCTANRKVADLVVEALCARLTTYEIELGKCARTRYVRKGDVMLRNFPELPYTDGPADWV